MTNKITFKTIVHESSWDGDWEIHEVLFNGKVMMSASEGIEPEDVCFGRDMMSPFDCEELLLKVIELTKAGEEIEFEYITISGDDE